jgi:uncharacterized membrane protein
MNRSWDRSWDRISGLAGRALLFGSLLSASLTACDGLPIDGAPAESTETQVGVVQAAPTAQTSPGDPMRARPQDRVTSPVDDGDRVALAEHVHPMARRDLEVAVAAPEERMDTMMLVLRPDDAQEQALQELLTAQHDPSSPLYQQWLTPETFAERFGISDSDVAKTTDWLKSHGLTIDQVGSGGRHIFFSGTTGQVEHAFQTAMRMYQVSGEIHRANATAPQIPRGLASVVTGVLSLHDFRAAPANRQVPFTKSDNTWYYNGTIQQSALVPGDLATIYNASPLYASGIDGSGQSIAVLGRSNIDLAEVRLFRKTYGLPANDPQVTVVGKDPGLVCGGDEFEAALDVEYAGAIAKKATVKFVVAGSTNTTDGIYLAAQYAVAHNVAPIVSLSYGLCERLLGTAGNALMNGLWQQAAAQGMSVFVSSMDSGAAGCDEMNAKKATGGLGVNGLASTVWNTAVGGTQFDDVSNRSTYWAANNDPVTQASALGYIPELAWNESIAGGDLLSSGGGVSSLYAKPAWQFGLGVTSDGKRDLPDLAFAAAVQDPYKLNVDKQVMGAGGTSAATPLFASIMGLVLQKVGQAQGLVNPVLYTLAYNQSYNGGAAVFHDVVKGSNTVPGQTGYAAGPGFDMVTGLGSVDATALVNHWQEGVATSGFQLVATSPTMSIVPGANTTASFTLKMNSGSSSAVQFSVTGLPAGVTSSFAPASLATSGNTTLTISATASAVSGVYAVKVIGTSGATSSSASVSLTVLTAPSLSLSVSASSLDVAAGASKSLTLSTTRGGSFNAAVTLSVAGAAKGITVTLSPTKIAAPGGGSSTLTATVASTVAVGTYAVNVTVIGGGITKTTLVALNVLPAPSFSLALGPSPLSIAPGATGTVTATTIGNATFNSAISLKVTGLPKGATASMGTISAPGSGSGVLSISVGSAVAPGKYTLTVTATGGGVSKSAALALQAPGISVSVGAASIKLKRGSSTSVRVSSTVLGGFSAQVAFSVQGLPADVSATFSPDTLPSPGSGSTTLKLTAGSTAVLGAVPLQILATATGSLKTAGLAMTVTK